MALRFTTLASGSKGNCSVIGLGGKQLMIDIGLSGKSLKGRLGQVGLSIREISEVLLTHTHSDHVYDTALTVLAEHGVWFWCHEAHQEYLSRKPGFQALQSSGLVLNYEERPFQTISGLTVNPIALRHGADKTFGFRVDHRLESPIKRARVAYFADIGCWDQATVDHFLDCNLIAMEFNHDVKMTLASNRHPYVIERNFSDDGHLSNDQAAGLLEKLLGGSEGCKPGNLVLLHISSQCNTKELAIQAATRVLMQSGLEYIRVIAADQAEASGWMEVPYSVMGEENDVSTSQLLPQARGLWRAGKKRQISVFQQEFLFPV